jgi:hypothetical protein
MLGLIAGWAQELDVAALVRSTERYRRDVVLVVARLLQRATARWIGATPALHPADVLDVLVGVLAFGATLALASIALVDAEFGAVGFAPGGVLLGYLLFVGFAMALAALAHLLAVRLCVGSDVRDHLFLVPKIRSGLRLFDALWVACPKVGAPKAVTLEAELIAYQPLGGVSVDARLLEIPVLFDRAGISTCNDERGIVAGIHCGRFNRLLWLGLARRCKRFASLLPFYLKSIFHATNTRRDRVGCVSIYG